MVLGTGGFGRAFKVTRNSWDYVHFAVTSNPTMEWTVHHLREATPFGDQPKYLFRDNDKIFGAGVPHFLKSSGSGSRTAVHGRIRSSSDSLVRCDASSSTMSSP